MIYQSKFISAHIHLLFVNKLKEIIEKNFYICSIFYVIFFSPVYPPATTSNSGYTTTEDVTSTHTTEDNILSTSTSSHTTENNILSTSDVYATATTESKYKITAGLKVETTIITSIAASPI